MGNIILFFTISVLWGCIDCSVRGPYYYYEGYYYGDDTMEEMNITKLDILSHGFDLVSYYNYYYPYDSQSVVLVDIYNITCYRSKYYYYYTDPVCFYSVRLGKTECQKVIPSGTGWVYDRRKKRKAKAKAAAAAADSSGTTKAIKTTKTKTTKTKTTITTTEVTEAPIFTVLDEECNAGRQKNPVEQFDLDAVIFWDDLILNMTFTVQGDNPQTKIVYYDLWQVIYELLYGMDDEEDYDEDEDEEY